MSVLGSDVEITFREKVLDLISVKARRFQTTLPTDVLERFEKYCQAYANDCYWLGILRLLDSFDNHEEMNVQLALVLELYDKLNTQHIDLQSQINQIKNNK